MSLRSIERQNPLRFLFCVVSFIISRLRESRTHWQPWVMKIRTRQAHEEDGQRQLMLTSCSTDKRFQECVVKRYWKSGGNGCCRTWRKGVSVTPNAADFRIYTANIRTMVPRKQPSGSHSLRPTKRREVVPRSVYMALIGTTYCV